MNLDFHSCACILKELWTIWNWERTNWTLINHSLSVFAVLVSAISLAQVCGLHCTVPFCLWPPSFPSHRAPEFWGEATTICFPSSELLCSTWGISLPVSERWWFMLHQRRDNILGQCNCTLILSGLYDGLWKTLPGVYKVTVVFMLIDLVTNKIKMIGIFQLLVNDILSTHC